MSLDGYITGPHGEADWIVMDPTMNFAELWAQFDTLLMGRLTYEAAIRRLGPSSMRGKRLVVASRTLAPDSAPTQPPAQPGITILPELTKSAIDSLREQGPNDGKDIWLMGGGETFSFLLALQAIDTVEVSIVPVLLGAGIPLLPPIEQRTGLKLAEHRIYPSGVVSLIYDVLR